MEPDKGASVRLVPKGRQILIRWDRVNRGKLRKSDAKAFFIFFFNAAIDFSVQKETILKGELIPVVV